MKQTLVNHINISFHFKMKLEQQAAQLRKQIEKIERVLNDGAALTATQRTVKENQVAALRQQLAVLRQQF